MYTEYNDTVYSNIRKWFQQNMPKLFRVQALLKTAFMLAIRFRLRMAFLTISEIFTGLRPIPIHSKTIFGGIKKAVELGKFNQIHLIDVGASDGWFVDAISRLVSIATGTCYEPLPDSWPPPRLGKAANKCVFRHVCVGSIEGKIDILISNHSGLSSVLGFHENYKYQFGGVGNIGTIQKRNVEIVTLDNDIKESTSDPIILKIDTQGFEMEVLKGASKLLSSGKIKIIVLELMIKLKYDSQTKMEELIPFLDSFEYEIYDIYKGYAEKSGQISEYDFIFCHKSLLTNK